VKAGALKTAVRVSLLVVHFSVFVSTVFSVQIVNKVAKATTQCLVVVTEPVKSSHLLDFNAFAMLITLVLIACSNVQVGTSSPSHALVMDFVQKTPTQQLNALVPTHGAISNAVALTNSHAVVTAHVIWTTTVFPKTPSSQLIPGPH